MVRVRVTGTYGPFNGNMTLVENPARSGRFGGLRIGVASIGDSFSAMYIDELTSGRRRNVRRTATFVAP